VVWLCTATIGGLALNSARAESSAAWQLMWTLELLGLTISLVGFALTYVRGDGEGVAALREATL
jgi:hypothetical protein